MKTTPAKSSERQREKEIIRKRLAALVDSSEAARQEIEASRRGINGAKGVPHSFDRLEELLAQQSYRLSFWKVAADEINYRRFFDINQLAADSRGRPRGVSGRARPAVRPGQRRRARRPESGPFRRPSGSGGVLSPPTGRLHVRSEKRRSRSISSPRKFWSATRSCAPTGRLKAPPATISWGLVNGLFVDRGPPPRVPSRVRVLHRLAALAATTWSTPARELILQTSMSGELNVLAGKLDRISEQHRWSRDFTLASLRHVLRETVACFPIYRTYITYRAASPDPEDEHHIRSAIARAKAPESIHRRIDLRLSAERTVARRSRRYRRRPASPSGANSSCRSSSSPAP